MIESGAKLSGIGARNAVASSESIRRELTHTLQCSLCLKPFIFESSPGIQAGETDPIPEWGTMQCPCTRYPVLGGVMVFDAIMAPRLTHLLDSGDWDEIDWILDEILGVPADVAHGQFGTIFEMIDRLTVHKPEMFEWHQHMKHFFATPKYLAVLPLTGFVERLQPKRVLDVGAGAGQLLRALAPYGRPRWQYLIDQDLGHLMLARRMLRGLRPSFFLLIDAEDPLPFRSDCLDLILNTDSLQFMGEQLPLLKEIGRIRKPEGGILFSHLHNVEGNELYIGNAHDMEGWGALFEEHCLGAGGTVLLLEDEALRREWLAGGKAPGDARLVPTPADTPSFSVLSVGADKPALPATAINLDALELILNPIYDVDPQADQVVLRRIVPSDMFEDEMAYCVPPSQVVLVVTSLDDPKAVETLYRQAILVHGPANLGAETMTFQTLQALLVSIGESSPQDPQHSSKPT